MIRVTMNANRHNDNLIRELNRLSRKILIPQFSTSCVNGFICENRRICLLRLYMKCFSTKCNSNKIASETFRIKIFMNGIKEELLLGEMPALSNNEDLLMT